MSETTLTDLYYRQYTLYHQLYAYESDLETTVKKYFTSAYNNDRNHQDNLFMESYYLNELVGYLKEQHSLVKRYKTHLYDEGPNAEWDSRVFVDHVGSYLLRKKCYETMNEKYFHNLWEKQLHFLQKEYLANKHLHSELLTNQELYVNPEHYIQVSEEC